MMKKKEPAKSQGFFLSDNQDFSTKSSSGLYSKSHDEALSTGKNLGLSTSKYYSLGSCSSSMENNVPAAKSGDGVMLFGTCLSDNPSCDYFLGQEKIAKRVEGGNRVEDDVRKAKKPRFDHFDAPSEWLSSSPLCVCRDAVDQSAVGAVAASYHVADAAPASLDLHVNPQDVEWIVTKTLAKSDINGQQNRLLIPKNLMDKHILSHFDSDEQVKEDIKWLDGHQFDVYDCDERVWGDLIFNIWKSESRTLTGSWKKCFVDRRKLEKGDEIGLSWDKSYERLLFTVLKRVR